LDQDVGSFIGQRRLLIEGWQAGSSALCRTGARKQKQTILCKFNHVAAAEMFNLSRKGFSAIILQLQSKAVYDSL
jgi:hypothetical protein